MSLATTLDQLLTDVSNGLEALGRKVPPRRYVHAGTVADDTEQLVVSLLGIVHGIAGQDPQNVITCTSSSFAQVEIRLTKVVAPMEEDGPPSAGQLDSDGKRTILDAAALNLVVMGLMPRSREWAMTTVNIPGPEGNFVPISIELSIPNLEAV